MMQDPAFLRSFLLDSIVTTKLPLANLSTATTVTTASGKVLAVAKLGGELCILWVAADVALCAVQELRALGVGEGPRWELQQKLSVQLA